MLRSVTNRNNGNGREAITQVIVKTCKGVASESRRTNSCLRYDITQASTIRGSDGPIPFFWCSVLLGKTCLCRCKTPAKGQDHPRRDVRRYGGTGGIISQTLHYKKQR